MATEQKDWDAIFSDKAMAKMAEDPEIAASLREHLARMRQVLSEFEAGHFHSLDEALRSIGMEPGNGDDDDDQREEA